MKILKQVRKKTPLLGFTMTEVIVATLIFSLAMAGVFASISELRQPAVESTQEVTAAFIGKRILEDLRSQVNAQSWDTAGSDLELGTHTGPGPFLIGGRSYTSTYTVIADLNGTSARQVILNVTW
jgi:prepilin-type N-terminal cleavage/methylation domain-containing protein